MDNNFQNSKHIVPEFEYDQYGDYREFFYKVVKEIRTFENSLSENEEIHATINGVEFCLEKISWVRTKSVAEPVFLALYGRLPTGATSLHVQALNFLNLSLTASRKEDAKSVRRSLIIDEE